MTVESHVDPNPFDNDNINNDSNDIDDSNGDNVNDAASNSPNDIIQFSLLTETRSVFNIPDLSLYLF